MIPLVTLVLAGRPPVPRANEDGTPAEGRATSEWKGLTEATRLEGSLPIEETWKLRALARRAIQGGSGERFRSRAARSKHPRSREVANLTIVGHR